MGAGITRVEPSSLFSLRRRAVGLYTLVATWIILKVVDAMVGLRVDEQDETNGLDISAHGEAGYND